MAAYTDYRFKFPIASLPAVANHLPALRAWIRSNAASLGPDNMLGDRFDVAGNPAVETADGSDNAAFAGRAGGAPGSDPAMMYFHIRAIAPLTAPPFSPASVGLVAVSAAESAAVLGVWA